MYLCKGLTIEIVTTASHVLTAIVRVVSTKIVIVIVVSPIARSTTVWKVSGLNDLPKLVNQNVFLPSFDSPL